MSLDQGSFDNPTFTQGLNQPASTSSPSVPGPIPRAVWLIVVGAIVGQAVLRKAFKNA